MASVYLDSSFLSACVTTRSDPHSAVRPETSLQWWSEQAPLHELCVSAEVLQELSHPGFQRQEAALELAAPCRVLTITPEAGVLAEALVSEKLMPGPASGDAVHVAVCCIHAVQYLVSWNVRHLANPRKVTHLSVICARVNLTPPRIVTPDLLWESES